MAKRRDEFVVRHDIRNFHVWGWDGDTKPYSAEEAIADFRCFGGGKRRWTAYLLVPVPLAEVEAQAARERRDKRKRRD